ncbi:MAG: hypothetical protein ACRC2T_07935 [Thermoguttaceae bacterium]
MSNKPDRIPSNSFRYVRAALTPPHRSMNSPSMLVNGISVCEVAVSGKTQGMILLPPVSCPQTAHSPTTLCTAGNFV